jgi:hypothetical protein
VHFGTHTCVVKSCDVRHDAIESQRIRSRDQLFVGGRGDQPGMMQRAEDEPLAGSRAVAYRLPEGSAVLATSWLPARRAMQ